MRQTEASYAFSDIEKNCLTQFLVIVFVSLLLGWELGVFSDTLYSLYFIAYLAVMLAVCLIQWLLRRWSHSVVSKKARLSFWNVCWVGSVEAALYASQIILMYLFFVHELRFSIILTSLLLIIAGTVVAGMKIPASHKDCRVEREGK